MWMQFARPSGSEWQRWLSGDYVINYLLGILTMTEAGGPGFPSGGNVSTVWKDKLHARDRMGVNDVRTIVAATLAPHAYAL